MHLENVGNPAVYSAKAQQLFKTAGLPRRLAEEVRPSYRFSFQGLMLLSASSQFSYTTKPTTVLRASAINLKNKMERAEGESGTLRTVLGWFSAVSVRRMAQTRRSRSAIIWEVNPTATSHKLGAVQKLDRA
jgi:hypothetical protein